MKSTLVTIFGLLVSLCSLMHIAYADVLVNVSSYEKMTLGQGFDPMRTRLANECIAGNEKRDGAGISVINLTIEGSDKNKLIAMAGEAGGELNLGLFGTSAGAEFVSRVVQKEKNESVIFAAMLDEAPRFLDVNPELNSFAKNLPSKSENTRFQACGSKFVRQINSGYRFLLSLSVDFDSQDTYEKMTIEKTVSAVFGLISRTETSTEERAKISGKATVSVRALQIGGDKGPLQTLLSSLKLNCDIANIEPCLAAHAAIVKFISAPAGAGGFTDVIARASALPTDHPFGPAVLSIVVSDYESAGVFDFVPKHDSESSESKLFAETFSRIESAIEREYDIQKQLALAEFAQLPNWVPQSSKTLAQSTQKMNDLKAAYSFCKKAPSANRCQTEAEKML